MLPREKATAAARAAAVMVRVHGPDPKGRKMRNHAFHHSESGDTTLSASGLLLHGGCGMSKNSTGERVLSDSMVLTCASIVEPFLAKHSLGNSAEVLQNAPTLIPGAEIDILMETLNESPNQEYCSKGSSYHESSSCWLPAKLVTLVDIPSAESALQGLLDAHGGSMDGSWEVGWALAQTDNIRSHQGLGTLSYKGNDPTPLLKSERSHGSVDSESHQNDVAGATTRVTILSVHIEGQKIMSGLRLSDPCKKGDFILVAGSPFGALSPLHFFNSLVAGIISNCWPPVSQRASLLMADLRCLPGMEGAPAFDENGAFVGLLARPLRQRGGGAEVQLVITWDAIVPPLRELGIDLETSSVKVHQPLTSGLVGRLIQAADGSKMRAGHQMTWAEESKVHVPHNLDDAIASVVLVTVGGAWASGVIINEKGLILTNAHLLEPWRFGKAQLTQGEKEVPAAIENATNEAGTATTLLSPIVTDFDCTKGFKRSMEQINLSSSFRDLDLQTLRPTIESGVIAQPTLEINYRSYRKIRIRLGQTMPRVWYDAKAVYISRGPLDIALLQLECAPSGLPPIKPEQKCPCPGTTAVVIGHGLFGPRSELCPSLSAGVVSRVVTAHNMLQLGSSEKELPAMLETTAAVHPGGSGGAVVNEQGLLIGLVTSNARHSGGTVIPHLNFSIPYAALKPVFLYASGDMKDTSLLSTLGKPNEQLAAVWALVPPTPPRPTQVMPFLPKLPSITDQKPELKGSRFAKFLTEKNAQLSDQSPPMHQRHGQLSKRWLVENTPHGPGPILHSRM